MVLCVEVIEQKSTRFVWSLRRFYQAGRRGLVQLIAVKRFARCTQGSQMCGWREVDGEPANPNTFRLGKGVKKNGKGVVFCQTGGGGGGLGG